jgi:hypothetical protein
MGALELFKKACILIGLQTSKEFNQSRNTHPGYSYSTRCALTVSSALNLASSARCSYKSHAVSNKHWTQMLNTSSIGNKSSYVLHPRRLQGIPWGAIQVPAKNMCPSHDHPCTQKHPWGASYARHFHYFHNHGTYLAIEREQNKKHRCIIVITIN